MSPKQPTVKVTFRGLTQPEIRSLCDFLEEQEAVRRIGLRFRTLDAAFDPSCVRVKNPADITALVVTLTAIIGNKALDLIADRVREWLKQRQTEESNVQITLIYGADEQVVRRIKKKPATRPK